MNQQAKNTLEQMLESVLMMLDGLEELHTDLKQAMEAV